MSKTEFDISSLYLKLQDQNYRNDSIDNFHHMDMVEHIEFFDWVRQNLELDRKKVFEFFYKHNTTDVNHHLAQAHHDYLSGYIFFSIDYLVMQMKLEVDRLLNS